MEIHVFTKILFKYCQNENKVVNSNTVKFLCFHIFSMLHLQTDVHGIGETAVQTFLYDPEVAEEGDIQL